MKLEVGDRVRFRHPFIGTGEIVAIIESSSLDTCPATPRREVRGKLYQVSRKRSGEDFAEWGLVLIPAAKIDKYVSRDEESSHEVYCGKEE